MTKTSATDLFAPMLNWKLRKGSHEFPGDDGGTCINEAAIVAAGLEYRPVVCALDCPPCFSQPIADYAISLNDAMPNSLRQKLLMPFVMRLANTADTDNVEQIRTQYIVETVMHKIVGVSHYRYGDDAVKVLQETIVYLAVTDQFDKRDVERFNRIADTAAVLRAIRDCRDELGTWGALTPGTVAGCIVATAQRPMAPWREIYKQAVEILDGAIMLGNHEPLEPELVKERLHAAKETVAAAKKEKEMASA